MNHQRNALLGIAGLLIAALVLVFGPKQRPPPAPPPTPLEAPVPLQEWTTADAGALTMRLVPGTLPAADPRQKHVACKEKLAQYIINGACWQRLPVPPPCPTEDGAYEHDDHKCYVRVLRAERSPQSGDVPPLGVAGP